MRLVFILSCSWLLLSCANHGIARKGVIKNSMTGPKNLLEKKFYSQRKVRAFEFQINEKIPHTMNVHVKKWIKYFQGRGKDLMGRYLSRMGRYQALMENVLEEQGVPRDLIYVALIESGFSSHAESHASAVGYWQFIKGTGKRYGLRVDHLVDERRDPVLATVAAAKYLKGLYYVFDSWYLAMASYNTGENRVKRVVMQSYTRDFWELVKRKKLPRETLNYVPKFLAAREIAKNPRKYGFVNVGRKKPIEFSTLKLSYPVNLRSLSRHMRVSYRSLKALNPQFRTKIAPTRRGKLSLRIPKGTKSIAQNAAQKSRVLRSRQIAGERGGEFYRVRSGDHLTRIAKKLGVSVRQLREWNQISRGSIIKVGQRLRVRSLSKYKIKRRDKENTHLVTHHQVIAGESLYRIARKYETTVSSLRKINGLSKTTLRIGKKLRVRPVEKSDIKRKTYIIRRGDTLIGIANKYGVSTSSLIKMNRLVKRERIYPGSQLLIP